jgi:hypothetical protein
MYKIKFPIQEQSGFATFAYACAFPNDSGENLARALILFYLTGNIGSITVALFLFNIP